MSQIKRFMQLFYHIYPPLSREEKLEQIDCIDAKWIDSTDTFAYNKSNINKDPIL